MRSRFSRRLIIGFMYFAIIFGTFFFFYYLFKTKATCFDGIKNQNEEDVDCGGRCFKTCKKMEAKDLIVGEVGVVDSSTPGEYDFYGIVDNPNSLYGSEYFDYKIEFKDESGIVIAEKMGNSFILPGEKKYLIENNIVLSKSPAKISLTVLNLRWAVFQDFYEKPDLKIINKTYGPITSGVGFYEAKGLLKNESTYDFAVIKIKVILKDVLGKIIALNSTEMRTVRSGENRDFRAFWPGRFSGEVGGSETQIEVNIFNSESFAKKNIKDHQFQEYAN